MDGYELILATTGIALGGFLKGATGAGAPVVGVPILAMAFGVPKAVAIFALLNLFSNTWQAWAYRSALGRARFVVSLALSGAVGAACGSVLLAWLSTDMLMAGLATVVFCYVALRLLWPDWRIARKTGEAMAAPAGFIGGVMQGAGGISAPVSVTYLNAMRLNRNEFVATISVFFFAMSAFQIPALVALGILNWERAGLALIAAIPLFGAMPLGEAAGKRFSKEAFDKLILTVLTLVALRLMYTALF